MPFAFFCNMIREPTENKLVPLKTNAFTVEPSIVNNNDAIFFLPKMISNKTSPENQKCNG